MDWNSIGIQPHPRYRQVPEASIIETLVYQGFCMEGVSDAARAEVAEALDQLVALGLQYQSDAGGRRFHPAEVENGLRALGLAGRHTFLSQRMIPTEKRIYFRKIEPEKTFRVLMRRTFYFHSIPKGTRLRLRAPLPLETDRFKLTSPILTDGDNRVSPCRLERRMSYAGENEVTLEARFIARCKPHLPAACAPLSEAERELYLRFQEGFIVVSRRVVETSNALVTTGASTWDKVRSLWDYLHDHLQVGVLQHDQINFKSPCDWVLDKGWFDCITGAALFAALCRAQGIPARLVGGHFLYPDAPAHHYWTEVWIEDCGWTPFDFCCWSLSHFGTRAERDRFYGNLDYRMVSEYLPRDFTGALGLPISPIWFLGAAIVPGGADYSLLNQDGMPIYVDRICVSELAA